METTWATFQGDASPIVHYEACLRKIKVIFSKEIVRVTFFEDTTIQSSVETLLIVGDRNKSSLTVREDSRNLALSHVSLIKVYFHEISTLIPCT